MPRFPCKSVAPRVRPGSRASRLSAVQQLMKKNYVLDTNILLHDPNAIFRFDDNNVVIPIYVIEEVDQFKREGSERGRNARHVVRLLDDLRETGGSLSKGVKTKSGGFLRVAIPGKRPELPTAIDKSANSIEFDDRIITALSGPKPRSSSACVTASTCFFASP